TISLLFQPAKMPAASLTACGVYIHGGHPEATRTLYRTVEAACPEAWLTLFGGRLKQPQFAQFGFHFGWETLGLGAFRQIFRHFFLLEIAPAAERPVRPPLRR